MPHPASSPATERTPLRIGMVYNLHSEVPAEVIDGRSADFLAEMDSPVTIDAIEAGIRAAGCQPVRIGAIENLVRFLAAGHAVDGVFNFAEGLWGTARESQVPGLLDAWRIPYTFSDPLTLAVCMDKALTKRIWLAHDLPTAPFAVAEGEVADADAAVEAWITQAHVFPLFVKPVREGSSKGVAAESVVHTPAELRARVRHLRRTYEQPVLIEPFLPGREFTVGVLGHGPTAAVLGVIEIAASRDRRVNGYDMKHPSFERHERFLPVDEPNLRTALADLGRRAYQVLGCRDAGRVDIRLNEAGVPHLLEINPIPGLHPANSALTQMAVWAGFSYGALIEKILYHAQQRWFPR
jgi:D-alanine-D-alanine ligase